MYQALFVDGVDGGALAQQVADDVELAVQRGVVERSGAKLIDDGDVGARLDQRLDVVEHARDRWPTTV